MTNIETIAHNIRTQDNRITDQPIFAVEQNRRKGWEFVTACFTEQGCRDYIAANGHNLHQPRVYVYSGYRNAEWQQVREWLSNIGAKVEHDPRLDAQLQTPQMAVCLRLATELHNRMMLLGSEHWELSEVASRSVVEALRASVHQWKCCAEERQAAKDAAEARQVDAEHKLRDHLADLRNFQNRFQAEREQWAVAVKQRDEMQEQINELCRKLHETEVDRDIWRNQAGAECAQKAEYRTIAEQKEANADAMRVANNNLVAENERMKALLNKQLGEAGCEQSESTAANSPYLYPLMLHLGTRTEVSVIDACAKSAQVTSDRIRIPVWFEMEGIRCIAYPGGSVDLLANRWRQCPRPEFGCSQIIRSI